MSHCIFQWVMQWTLCIVVTIKNLINIYRWVLKKSVWKIFKSPSTALKKLHNIPFPQRMICLFQNMPLKTTEQSSLHKKWITQRVLGPSIYSGQENCYSKIEMDIRVSLAEQSCWRHAFKIDTSYSKWATLLLFVL